jgi:hypothetical protein
MQKPPTFFLSVFGGTLTEHKILWGHFGKCNAFSEMPSILFFPLILGKHPPGITGKLNQ